MGLDVSVYQNNKVLDINEDDEDYDYDFHAFAQEEEWEDRIKNLEKDRFYEGDQVAHLVSYPYSSHNRFREELIRLIGRSDLLYPHDGKINWDKLHPEKNLPFYELIYFSDCEGVLDWQTSEKLYNDFKNHEFFANQFFKEEESNLRRFNNWMETFELGKDNGVVVFR
jgi:hypothetical protein